MPKVLAGDEKKKKLEHYSDWFRDRVNRAGIFKIMKKRVPWRELISKDLDTKNISRKLDIERGISASSNGQGNGHRAPL